MSETNVNEQKNFDEAIEKVKDLYQDVIDSLKKANEETKKLVNSVRSKEEEKETIQNLLKEWFEAQKNITKEFSDTVNEGVKSTFDSLPKLSDLNLKEELEKATDKIKEEVNKVSDRATELFDKVKSKIKGDKEEE